VDSETANQALISRQAVKESILGGIPDSTLDKWQREGRFPRSFHPGGSKRAYFLRAAIDRWLVEQAGAQAAATA